MKVWDKNSRTFYINIDNFNIAMITKKDFFNAEFLKQIKGSRLFILAVEKIASSLTAPFWKAGDKFEAAGKKLYKK